MGEGRPAARARAQLLASYLLGGDKSGAASVVASGKIRLSANMLNGKPRLARLRHITRTTELQIAARCAKTKEFDCGLCRIRLYKVEHTRPAC